MTSFITEVDGTPANPQHSLRKVYGMTNYTDGKPITITDGYTKLHRNTTICANLGWKQDDSGWQKPDGTLTVSTPDLAVFAIGLDALIQTGLWVALEYCGPASKFIGKDFYHKPWICRLEQVVPEPEGYFCDYAYGDTAEKAVYAMLLKRYGPSSDPFWRTPSDTVSYEERP